MGTEKFVVIAKSLNDGTEVVLADVENTVVFEDLAKARDIKARGNRPDAVVEIYELSKVE